MSPFVPLALTLPLLSANPPLQDRLQLGAQPAPHTYSASRGEVLAGAGGAMLGHLAFAGLVLEQNASVFRSCDGDVCGISTLYTVSLAVSELVLAPGASALFAWLASPDPFANLVKAYGVATVAHLGCLLLAIPAIVVGGDNTDLAVAMLLGVMALDVGLTGWASAAWLHDSVEVPPPAEPKVIPPDVPSPMLQPPPPATRVVVPLSFRF